MCSGFSERIVFTDWHHKENGRSVGVCLYV